MCQKAFSRRICMEVRPHTGVDIIVHLNITDPVILHQSPHHFPCILLHLRIPEIQLISAVINHRSPVSLEKPFRRHLIRQGTFLSHHLQLQPQSRGHIFAPYIPDHLLEASWKSFLAGKPFSHSVPPVSV